MYNQVSFFFFFTFRLFVNCLLIPVIKNVTLQKVKYKVQGLKVILAELLVCEFRK